MKKINKGFTLIELLVVVAIIGILAMVVLASLKNARDKAKDAAIQETLSHFRTTAEVYLIDNEYNFNGLCNVGNPGNIGSPTAIGVIAVGGTFNCSSDTNNFRVYSSLASGEYSCINSLEQQYNSATAPQVGTFDC